MMNFLYDLTAAQPTSESKFHGAGIYAEIIFFKILEEIDAKKIALFAAYDSKRYINPKIFDAAKNADATLIDINAESPAKIFEKYKITRFYSALLDEFIPWNFCGCEVITTVHGLRGLEMPLDIFALKYFSNAKQKIKYFLKLKIPFFNKRNFKKEKKGYERFFDGRKKIITVSNHSKASILSFFPNAKESDIKVFFSPSFDCLAEGFVKLADFSVLAKKLEIERKKYFLLTSGARWMKNAMRAIFAFDELFSEGKLCDFKVVLTGVTEKCLFEKRIKNKSRFVFEGFVERPELEALNKNAYCFVFPTLNEGFGYPPLEAMKYCTPSICSGTASMPEICAQAALYFNPYSISEIKNRIVQTTFPKVYERLCLASKIQYEKIFAMQKKDLESLVEFLFCKNAEAER